MDSKPDNSFVAAPCLAISAALFFLGTGLALLWPLDLARSHSSALGRFASLCQTGVFCRGGCLRAGFPK